LLPQAVAEVTLDRSDWSFASFAPYRFFQKISLSFGDYGAPGEIRTPDLLVRRW